MFHARVQRNQMQSVGAGFDQPVDSFFEKIEEGELVTSPCFTGKIEQRNGNRGRGRFEVRNDFLVTDHLQNVTHGLRQLTESDNWFVVSQPQIKGNAFRDMIGQPPTWIAGFIGRAGDGGVQPIAVELEELTRVAAQIRKFFFKRYHE